MPPASCLHRVFDKKKKCSSRQNSSSLLPWVTRITFLWEEPCGRVSPLGESSLSTLRIISTRRTGRLALVLVGEVPPLDLEQGTPWILDHEAGGGASLFTSVHEKIFQNRIVRQGRGARGWRECVNVEGALLCLRRGRETKILGEYEILQISIHHWIKIE